MRLDSIPFGLIAGRAKMGLRTDRHEVRTTITPGTGDLNLSGARVESEFIGVLAVPEVAGKSLARICSR